MKSAALAYLNGCWIDASQLALPVWDYGTVMGAAVSDLVRTFGGRPVWQREHVDRFLAGLTLAGIELPISRDELDAIIDRVARQNYESAAEGNDFLISLMATPGWCNERRPIGLPPQLEPRCGATVCVYALPLPLALHHRWYTRGLRLTTVPQRAVPAACWPKAIKSRSRLQAWLAQRAATARDGERRALLLDLEGQISEGAAAAVALWHDEEGLIAPPEADVFPSIAWRTTARLAQTLGHRVVRRTIALDELAEASEVFWLSAPVCVAPVTAVDDRVIGRGVPGPMFAALVDAWSAEVGIDLPGQARRAAAEA
jgi:branched-subunit amino acid aminotransferase/4-amino-4-deoxychorismate lyase